MEQASRFTLSFWLHERHDPASGASVAHHCVPVPLQAAVPQNCQTKKTNKFPRPTNHRWARLFLFQIYGCQHVGQCWTSFRTWTWSRPTNDQMILPITLHKCSKWQSSWTWRHVLYLKECSQCTARYPFNPHKCRSLQENHLKKNELPMPATALDGLAASHQLYLIAIYRCW